MKYTQKNPLEIPETGEYQRISTTMDSIFDWKYQLERQNLLALYEKGKGASWNSSDLDWDTPVDIDTLMKARVDAGMTALSNQLLDPPVPFDDENGTILQLHMNAFMLSQFLHGEQGALLAAAKIALGVPWQEAKFYAANQVQDEARHVECYHRYLTEKLGLSYPVVPSLQALLHDIVEDSRWDITFLGMQIMVEGLALAAFGLLRVQMGDEPLIQDIISRIMGDEARHVAFGVLALQEVYAGGLSESEMREREEFVIESCHLLRDRISLDEVFRRLDYDLAIWSPWQETTPYMAGYRQMLFSKIVPNLKRLGLLTPRVREAFEKMDILQYESLRDSVEEPEVAPPEELIQFLMVAMQNLPEAIGSTR